MLNFILIGAAGFIAPRHMKAIKETRNKIIAAMDPSDNVGVLDKYFPEANFFLDFSRLDRFISKFLSKGNKIDFIVICTPNFLHDYYIRYSLKNKINVICEKPLVINLHNLLSLKRLEKSSKKKVNTILQLRHHPNVIRLYNDTKTSKSIHEIELTYITSRGQWYHVSWKGEEDKSGGILMNIGIHFFDLLIWIFGDVIKYELHFLSKHTASGYLILKKARVKWFLSIDYKSLPQKSQNKNLRTFRSIRVDKKDLGLDYDFDKLHTITYQNVLKNKGHGIRESIKSIKLVNELKETKPNLVQENIHKIMKELLKKK